MIWPNIFGVTSFENDEFENDKFIFMTNLSFSQKKSIAKNA